MIATTGLEVIWRDFKLEISRLVHCKGTNWVILNVAISGRNRGFLSELRNSPLTYERVAF